MIRMNSAYSPGITPEPITYLTATATIKPYQTRVSIDNGSSAAALTLPSAAECEGLIFTIEKTAGSGDLTVDVSGTTVTIAGTAGSLVVFSNGYTWFNLGGLGQS